MPHIKCPSCDHTIHVHTSVQKMELVSCPNCHSIFEVTQINPLRIGWPDDPQIPSSRRIIHKII